MALAFFKSVAFNFFPRISFYLTDVHIVILGLANIALASSIEITSIDLNITPQTHSSRFHEPPHLQVHAPIFTAFPSSLTVARGAAASFEATLNAPPATVAWMKDGKEVKEQAMKHRITASGNKVHCFSLLYINMYSGCM